MSSIQLSIFVVGTELQPIVTWTVEFVNDECGYSTEKKFKQELKIAHVVLAAYSKMREEKDKLRKEILNKREPGLESWEKFQPIQTGKDTKIRFDFRKGALERKLGVWLDNLLFLSQQE